MAINQWCKSPETVSASSVLAKKNYKGVEFILLASDPYFSVNLLFRDCFALGSSYAPIRPSLQS